MNGLPGLGGSPTPQVPLDQLLGGLIQMPPAVTAPQLFSGGDPNTSMQIANQVTAPQSVLPPGATPPGPGPMPPPQAPQPPGYPQAPMPPQTGGPQASRYTFGTSALAPKLAGLGAQQFSPPIRPTGFGM